MRKFRKPYPVEVAARHLTLAIDHIRMLQIARKTITDDDMMLVSQATKRYVALRKTSRLGRGRTA